MRGNEKKHRNTTIIEAVKSGRLMADVAREHGLSRCRVWDICRRKGVTSVYRFSKAEKQQIFRQYKRGFPPKLIEVEGRRSTAAYEYLVRVGLHTPQPEAPLWEADEDAVLRAGYYTDGSRIVAEKLGRTRNEVIGRADRLRKLGLLKRIY